MCPQHSTGVRLVSQTPYEMCVAVLILQVQSLRPFGRVIHRGEQPMAEPAFSLEMLTFGHCTFQPTHGT